MTIKIGLCGLGNMGKAILKGIVRAGVTPPDCITVFDVHRPLVEELRETFDIGEAASEAELAKGSDVLILAVKPDTVPAVLEKVKHALPPETVVVSIAAGVSLERLEAGLRSGAKVVRAMPNAPALILEGMTALTPNEALTGEDRATIQKIFASFGKAEIVTENQMDAVVAVSGSSPAYTCVFIEALADGAVLCGMPRNVAYAFASQAVLGTARMLLETGKHPGELKDMVSSPGGTTIAALRVLEKGGFRGTVMEAVKAAAEMNKCL